MKRTIEEQEIHRREYMKKASKDFYNNVTLNRSFEELLYKSCKKNANNLGRDFNIALEDLVIPEVCPYIGTPITNIKGQGLVNTNPSVDRIDNTQGYVKGNIQIVSILANRMKSNASLEELVSFAHNVLRLHG